MEIDIISFDIALDVCSSAICLIIAVLRMVVRDSDTRGIDGDAYNAMCLATSAYCACDALLRGGDGLGLAVYIAGAGMVVAVVMFFRALMRFSAHGLETFGISWALKIFPVLSVVVGLLAPAVATTSIICTGGLLLVLVGGLPLRERAIERAEAVLARARADAALSQIQPHFVHNTLAAIRYLAREDPSRAADMLDEFSAYLHGNMASLTQVGPIPFKDELNHTLQYLKLEQLRQGDRLNVSYAIGEVDFTLPPLSLQTLAENAVRHGISKRPEGGSLAIRTWRDADHIVVEVADDGVGFDTTSTIDDGRPHVGLVNTRLRLASMCGGSLDVSSAPGTGTFARICVPVPVRDEQNEGRRAKRGAR